jgi:hypothetical protein
MCTAARSEQSSERLQDPSASKFVRPSNRTCASGDDTNFFSAHTRRPLAIVVAAESMCTDDVARALLVAHGLQSIELLVVPLVPSRSAVNSGDFGKEPSVTYTKGCSDRRLPAPGHHRCQYSERGPTALLVSSYRRALFPLACRLTLAQNAVRNCRQIVTRTILALIWQMSSNKLVSTSCGERAECSRPYAMLMELSRARILQRRHAVSTSVLHHLLPWPVASFRVRSTAPAPAIALIRNQWYLELHRTWSGVPCALLRALSEALSPGVYRSLPATACGEPY